MANKKTIQVDVQYKICSICLQEIPFENLSLNSSDIKNGLRNIVRPSFISVRDTGDITLEDATDTTHGFLVLNSTSGASTNAGESIRFEGGTGISV